MLHSFDPIALRGRQVMCTHTQWAHVQPLLQVSWRLKSNKGLVLTHALAGIHRHTTAHAYSWLFGGHMRLLLHLKCSSFLMYSKIDHTLGGLTR